jgi:hypothetical protein
MDCLCPILARPSSGYLSVCFSEKKPTLFFVENATNKQDGRKYLYRYIVPFLETIEKITEALNIHPIDLFNFDNEEIRLQAECPFEVMEL